MRSPSPPLLAAAVALLVLVEIAAIAWGLGEPSPGRVPAGDLARGDLLRLALLALLGRVVLAWLPAGLPGRHAPRELPATWAASHLAGVASVLLRAWIPQRPGAGDAAADGLGGGLLALLAYAWPWLVLFVARLATLPAPMVPPRPDPEPARGGAAAFLRAGLVVALAGAALLALARGAPPGTERLPFPLDGGGLLGAGHLAALAVIAHHGFARSRVQPHAALAAALLLATLPPLVLATAAGRAAHLVAPLGLVAAASLLLAWRRTADRRAATLSAAGLLAALLAAKPWSA